MSTEKKLTAMQEVIVKMQEAKDHFPNVGFDEEFIRGFNKAFQIAIFIVEKIGVEKEKQQIIDAGDKCISNYLRHEPERHGNVMPSGEQYYEQTFKN